MSIFPKRTLRGTHVTIHWNFGTAQLTDSHIYPYVRIGVQAPNGQLTLLHDGHILRLPGLPPKRRRRPWWRKRCPKACRCWCWPTT
ncbi:MAG: hypothetical protein WKG07_03820 [Hymenobacter sp.]